MNWVDIGIIVVLVLAAISGWRSGMIPGLVLLGGILIGTAIAGRYAQPLGNLLLSNHGHAKVAGFAIIIGLAVLVTWPLGIWLQNVAHALWLGWVDRLGGVVLGVAVSLLLLSVLLTVAASSHAPRWAAQGVSESRLAPDIVDRGSFVQSLLPDDLTVPARHSDRGRGG